MGNEACLVIGIAQVMETVMTFSLKACFALGAVGLTAMLSQPAEARYAPVVHQAQSQLAGMGHDPGVLDGYMGRNTAGAIRSYQAANNLPETGQLDSATLESLNISVTPATDVEDWRPVPSVGEMAELSQPINDPDNAYADYRKYAPAAGLDLPGKAVLAAMNKSADQFRSRLPGHPNYNERGYKLLRGCLKTTHYPDHWSDITVHYYCQMSLPRKCFTNALAGKSTRGVKLSRPRAYAGCAGGQLADAAAFKWVTVTQPLIFQYIMFAQTHAFKHDQEQAIINAFYGVTDPTDRAECNKKRPRRTEDPSDGTHCLVDKEMSRKLVGRSR